MTSTSELLSKAADLLEENGWIQHTYDSEGQYCSEGALRKALCDKTFWLTDEEEEALYPAELALADVVDPGWREQWLSEGRTEADLKPYAADSIVAWNDEEGRTATEVIEAFRDAAGRA